MKVYVDELPKNCAYCPYYYGNSQGAVCKLTGIMTMWNETLGEMQSKCSLQTLSDYTKQVRKEVCDEIKETMIKRFNGVIQGHYSEEHKDGYSHCCSDIEYNILDQVQGENYE